MSRPGPIIGVLAQCRPAFTAPTWRNGQVLRVGRVLARGRRTVAAALRQMGHAQDGRVSRLHQVLTRAGWSGLELSRRLLRVPVAAFVAPDEGVTVVIDETLERRWGRRITKRGHPRDPLRSSKGRSAGSSGLRWIVCAVVARVPRTARRWALPFLSILASPPELSAAQGRRHKTIGQWAQQAAPAWRRWLPDRAVRLVGDASYASVELGLARARHGVALIAPLRLDANLFAPPPPRPPGRAGRPRVKGAAVPKLSAVLADPATAWQRVRVRWYDGPARPLELASGTALWYRGGLPPLPIRWVLTRDPAGQREPRAHFATDPDQTPVAIVHAYMQRWPVEVTIEECRAHLGVQTQRQRSDRAIARTTPCLFGLLSLVALFAHALHPAADMPVERTAWYPKPAPTFSDVLAEVRRHLWRHAVVRTSPTDPDVFELPRLDLDRLADALCA